MNRERRVIPKKYKIKKGDRVVILAGGDRGKIGEVSKVYPKLGKVTVEGVNLKTKHIKGDGNNKGKITKISSPIDYSNVMFYSEKKSKAGRIGYKILKDGSKVRVMKKHGEIGDEYGK